MRWRSLFLAIIPALLISAGPSFSQQDLKDSSLRMQPVEKRDYVALVATSAGNLLEATVTVTAMLDNMQPSSPLPCTGTVSGAGSSAIMVYLRPRDSYRRWNYQYDFHWQAGIPANSIPMPFLYILPFERGAAFRVTQGARGGFSHQIGTSDENAIDFAMPEGSVVCAARGGLVVAVRGDSNIGGADNRYSQAANYIVIKHGDGSYGNYMHFKQNGLLVRLGQQVAAGTPIGLSGNTGHSSRPHLHFDSYWLRDGVKRISIPLRFQSREGPLEALEGMIVTREQQ